MTANVKVSRADVLDARAAKRAHAESLGVTEQFVSQLVDEFYGRIREDDLLGPIFAERISEWPAHLERMKSFWRSVLFNSGEFAGNPMSKHIEITGLEEHHFTRWLDHFYATLRTLSSQPESIRLVADRARAIADSLLTGIAIGKTGISGSTAGRNLPHV